jgi:uncharacterized membrane protein YedE/YeeE
MKPTPVWNPYLGGIALGLVLFASIFVTGHGLGASGGVARLMAAAEDVVAPQHVDRTPAIATFAGGDRNPLDHWLVWELLGVLLGGFLAGLVHRRLGFETFRGAKISIRGRWGLALLGGVIMGYGARLARGCTSGQGLSGGAVLAVGSWAFLFAVFIGGYAVAYFVRRQWQEA